MLTGKSAENDRYRNHNGCHQQGHRCQFCIGPEQHRHDASDGEQISGQGDKPAGKQFVESFDITGDPGDEATDRVAMEETGTLFL